MKHKPIIYLIIFFTLLARGSFSQDFKKEDSGDFRVSLNDWKKYEKVALKKPILRISARSLRSENLSCKVFKSGKLVKEMNLDLAYGVNEEDIPLGDLQASETYHFQFKGKFFGKGEFDFYIDENKLITNPIADLRVNPVKVSCDKISDSSVEYFGSVSGGVSPYKLTWLISKGPLIQDLINEPLKFQLSNESEVSKVIVADKLDYYVTLMIEDACGNSDKKVFHIKCEENNNDGMIYFQPIELFDKTTNSGL